MPELKLMTGHKPPGFRMWSGFRYARFEPVSEDDFHLPQWTDGHPVLTDGTLSTYYFLFALRRALESGPSYDSVTITQYRRFATKIPIGVPSSTQPDNNVITPEEAGREETAALITARRGGWLIPAAYDAPVITQFHHHHILRDYYRLLCDSFDAGFLTQDEVYGASTSHVFVPSASMGVYPAAFEHDVLVKLENCVRAFVEGGYIPREGYQRRVLGFCLERLHGFLIVQELERLGIGWRDVMGKQIVVSDTLEIIPSI